MAPLGIDDSKWPEVMRQANRLASYIKNTVEYMPTTTEHPLIQYIRIPQFQALMAYIRRHPKEVTARGVLADWLEENGESEYAAWIRYECGLWGVPEGYNYDKYTDSVMAGSFDLFDKGRYTRSTYRRGLLEEVKQIQLDNWLTKSKLAYAVGCVRRVEINYALWPMCRSGNSWGGGYINRTANLYECDGFTVNRALHKELYELIELTDFDVERSDSPNAVIVINDRSQRVETKLLKAISRASILHAKHSAIADGIACE